MLRDQEQASKLDLSQSAYDELRKLGVEDAKRFLHRYQECGSGTNLTTNDCKNMATAMNADSTTDCYVLATAEIGKKVVKPKFKLRLVEMVLQMMPH